MTTFKAFPRDADAISSDNVGQALAGLIARTAGGVPRVGMLAAPSVGAVAAAWKVEVGRFVYVHQVSGAVQFSGLSSAEQVDIVSASGLTSGQARIDVVAWDPVTAVLSVVQGAAATSPVVPSVGALAEVARVRVSSGDAMVVNVTPSYVLTKLGDVTAVAFGWDAAKVTVVRSELEISAGWARLRFHVVRKTGSWVSGEVIGTVPVGFRPSAVEFAPVSITPVGPVGNVAIRPDGTFNVYAVSGTTAIGEVGWPF